MKKRLHMALLFAAKHDDAKLKKLIDNMIADRKAMIAAESDRVEAVEALIAGIRAGKTREELADETQAVKAAGKKVREAAQKIRKDMEAIGDRLRELGLKPKSGHGQKGKGPRGEGRRGKDGQGRGRGNRRERGDRPARVDRPLEVE